MIEPIYLFGLWSTVIAGVLLMALGLVGRPPSGLSLSLTLGVELFLVFQLAVSIGIVIGGQRAQVSTLEYFGYLFVALLIPLAAAWWAIIEKSRWSTFVLGAAALTVAVMIVRMWSLWTGIQIN